MEALELPFVDLASPAFEAAPYGAFAAARERCWLARTTSGLAVLTLADARELLRNPAVGFSFGFVDPELSPFLHERLAADVQALSGAAHQRVRRVAVRALRTRVVDALREPMRRIVDELLDAALLHDELDLVAEVLAPYPTRVVGPILGVPLEDTGRIDTWATDLLLVFDVPNLRANLSRIESSWRAMEDYLRDLLERRRAEPGDDVFSELLAAEPDGEPLSEDELLALVVALTRAALDTTRGQLGFTMEAFVRHPDQWERLVADPGLAPRAVEEGLRYAPAVSGIPHVLAADVVHRGVLLPAGTHIEVHPRATNRDPAAFSEPNRFDIGREQRFHLAFGYGPHACVGAALARVEMTEALRALAGRVAAWELAGPVRHQPMSSNGNRLSLPVRARPAVAI